MEIMDVSCNNKAVLRLLDRLWIYLELYYRSFGDGGKG